MDILSGEASPSFSLFCLPSGVNSKVTNNSVEENGLLLEQIRSLMSLPSKEKYRNG